MWEGGREGGRSNINFRYCPQINDAPDIITPTPLPSPMHVNNETKVCA